MPWFAYALIAAYIIGIVVNILSIGKPRSPVTAGIAASQAIIALLCIWAIVELASS